jgi:putative drug exporter of the RND superfamily
MQRLATLITRHPVRVLLVWLLAVAALLTLTSPGGVVDRSDVMESDQAKFLPDRYESVRAAQLEQRGFPTPDGATATIVVRRPDGRALTGADVTRAGQLAERVGTTPGVRTAVADRSGLSANRKVLLGAVLFDRTLFDIQLAKDVDAVRDRSDAVFERSGLVAGYAGEAPTQVDAQEREGLTSQLTMAVIALLLLVLFRSIVVALFDVVLVALVGMAATAMLLIGAKLFGFSIDTLVTGLLPIVVLGVGTDYVVFLLHRYRERLRAGDEPRAAMHHAITRIGPAIGFSALAVVVSLSALMLSSLASFRVLGPALGFGVLSTLVAAMTLMPAVAVLLRRGLFWPSRERARRTEATEPNRFQRFVAGKPVGAVVASAAVLVALAVPALGFKADYDVEATVAGSPSAKAFDELRRGFPEGALVPTKVLVTRDDGGRLTPASIAPLAAALRATPDVGRVMPAALSKDGRIARIDALLDTPPYTGAALDTIERHIRPAVAAAAPAGTIAEVGGNTSAYADVRDAIQSDQKVIFPVAALLVGLILVVLLRSLAVPLFVMVGVALGFAATLGGSVIAFQHLGSKDGLTYSLPLVVYLFVASMVSDYAILILSRVREELSAGRSPQVAATIALRTAGPSVTAAGLVLAASFGVLVISPSTGQIGFAIGFGILLSALVTARVFVPALTVLAGRRGWWPSRLARNTNAEPRIERPRAPEPEPVAAG